MITVQDIFDDLSYGEATQLAIAQSTVGTISENNYPRVVSLLNRALVKMAERFQLKIAEVDIQQIAGQTLYPITSEHAGTTDEIAADSDLHVIHTDELLFEDNLIKILRVYDADGTEYTLEDSNTSDSMFTPEFNVLKMTPEDTPVIVSVEYQATLPRIVIPDTGTFYPEKINVNIPRTLIGPLNIYIVHLLLSGMNTRTAEGEQSIQSTWLNRFELAVRELQNNNVLPDRQESQSHFENNGFV